MHRLGTFTSSFGNIVTRLVELPDTPTADEFLTAMSWAGRNSSPGILASYFEVTGDSWALGEVLHHAWTGAEYPEDEIGPDLWEHLFMEAGYRVDGILSPRPETVTLYRGCPDHLLSRMSWTSSRSVAEIFANGGIRGRGPGRVWTVEASGGELLAQINERDEAEYVVSRDLLAQIRDRAAVTR